MKQTGFAVLAIAVVAGLLPTFLSKFGIYLATEMIIFGIFAMSLGLIMGYGGMPSLGHSAFLGLGAYTVGILSNFTTNTYVLLAAAVVISGIFAYLSGLIAIRNKGIFFLMITLAFAQMLYLMATKMRAWGGADGMGVKITANFGFGDLTGTNLYFVVVVFFLLCYALLKFFVGSPVGKALKGTMENEHRMEALGYNTRHYKVLAYTLAGAMAGLAGALYVYKTRFVSPDILGLAISSEVMIMVFVGGIGTLFGPVIGAATFIALQNYVSTYTDRWSLIMGIVFIAIVLYGRGGLISLFKTAIQSLIRKKGKSIELTESRESK